MYTADDFRQAFEDYAVYNDELIKNTGMMGGILKVFGFGKAHRDEGHEKFYQEMKMALEQVVKAQPDEETADAIADVIFHAKNLYPEDRVSPYIFPAIEYLTIDLLPFLSVEKTEELLKEYRKTPYRLRVPVQKQTLAALEKVYRKRTAG